MQLLWLLLSPDQDVSFSELSELLSNESSGTDWGVALPGLLWSECSKPWGATLASLMLSPRC